MPVLISIIFIKIGIFYNYLFNCKVIVAQLYIARNVFLTPTYIFTYFNNLCHKLLCNLTMITLAFGYLYDISKQQNSGSRTNLQTAVDIIYVFYYFIVLVSISSRAIFKNSSTLIEPISPSLRERTDTVPFSISLSPIKIIYGTFSSCASLIL